MQSETIPRARLTGILACFFASGAAGLVYQVAWGKSLSLIFGSTVYAIATVLAVFMGGLAWGSAVIGRWGERLARPVAAYGWIELAIAACGLLSLAGLPGVRALYFAAYPSVADSVPLQIILRIVASALVLLPPTFLMGGTLPLLVKGLTRHSAELGLRVSRLYWVNTAGAVAGTLAAGFVLLPELGLRATIASAVALNVSAGLIALLLARAIPSTLPTIPIEATTGISAGPSAPRFLLVTFAGVGATAMAYEIGWTRLLATLLGSSTYAFTLMLATFLTGIVLGSFLFERWVARGREVNLTTYAVTQVLTALAALAFLLYFERLPQVVPPILRATDRSFAGLVLVQFVASALAMLPTAIAFGVNFPAVTLLITGRGGTLGHAAAVGRAYAANTLGAIAGALATGFWLLPAVGGFRVVALAAAANLFLAVLVELKNAPRRPLVIAAVAALVVIAAGIGATGALYNQSLATFATVLYWDLYHIPLTLAEVADTTDVLFAEDGLNASIAVVRTEDYIALRTNGKVDASNRDVITQLLVGHLGPIFHAAPRRVLVIGFGSGMTVSAVARYPEVEQIDCVEIEPAVIRAAPHLTSLNRGVLRDPRVRIVLDDARNFLLTTRESYDVIISEPSNPWIASVSALFTEEFYHEARARLRPGGIFVQWVQAYSLFPDDFRMILATFLAHFPRATLWRAESADFLLLAQTADTPLSLDRLRSLWLLAELRADYEQLGLRRPEGLLAFHLLDDGPLRGLSSGAPRNTDDQTRLEYRAPRALLGRGLEDRNSELVARQRPGPFPPDIPVSDQNLARLAVAETLLHLEEHTDALRLLEPVPEDFARGQAEMLRGQILLALFRHPEARAAFGRALQLDPNLVDAAYGLADLARRQLSLDTADLLFRQILFRRPDYPPALEGLAQVEMLRNRWAHAADWQLRAIAAQPAAGHEAYVLLGDMYANGAKPDAAEQAYRTALDNEPYSFRAHRNLAELYRRQKRWTDARRHLEAIVRYHPDRDAAVYVALTEACRMAGDIRAARVARDKAFRLFPDDTEVRSIPPLP